MTLASDRHVIAVDLGTSEIKVGLYRLKGLDLVAARSVPLFPLIEGTRVEFSVNDWWSALRNGIHEVLKAADVNAELVSGVSFCGQMQSVVLIDERGEAVRNAISYLDGRAQTIFDRTMRKGLLKIQGLNALKILMSVVLTQAASASCKDPFWKILWVKENEPEVYTRVKRWVDAKDYLIVRSTGRICTTEDSAYLTFLYGVRRGLQGWSRILCRLFGIDFSLLPEVVRGDEVVGHLLPDVASELGLIEGTPVIAGGGDVGCAAWGAGAAREGHAHLYIGTSGWIGVSTHKSLLDVRHLIASLRTSIPGVFQYTGELQSAGMCLAWAKKILDSEDSLKSGVSDFESFLDQSPPGAKGLVFTPWLGGSRSPFEDPNARAIFFGMGLEHEKADLVRSVYEGVAYHLRWIRECMESRVPLSRALTLVGGGAKSMAWAQIIADICDVDVLVSSQPQMVGARGAAALASVALGESVSIVEAASAPTLLMRVMPRKEYQDAYLSGYARFRSLYPSLKRAYRIPFVTGRLESTKMEQPIESFLPAD